MVVLGAAQLDGAFFHVVAGSLDVRLDGVDALALLLHDAGQRAEDLVRVDHRVLDLLHVLMAAAQLLQVELL